MVYKEMTFTNNPHNPLQHFNKKTKPLKPRSNDKKIIHPTDRFTSI